ncbi:ABC transporter substrate-binding protein [Bacillus suaedae]|uniref:Extracellular solute-binding protein n=1 Tax=Halalkalibacter suaedae TaxID=2822140 RepID=A0A940WZW1_9BACI|nr:extracellular solute-binding protein [Bacillus suaedae]MBP3951921.1 extracellular solute-binding protein [Bacillus suaedae]
MKVKLKFILLLLVSLFFIAACGGTDATTDEAEDPETTDAATDDANEEAPAGEENVTIRFAWWGGQERHDMTLEAIELFQAEYPNITVEAEYTGWDGYWERLNTQAAGSNLPDVISMDNSKLNEYNSRDLLADLTPFIEAGTINLENVDSVYQEINHIDGEVLGISAGANALAALINRTVLDEHGIDLQPGYTYEDLYDAMIKIKEAEEGEFFGYDLGNAEFEMFTFYARQNEESLFNEEGTGLGYSDETLENFFTFIQKMVKDGASPSHDVTMEYIEGGLSIVAEGTAAMGITTSNQIIGVSQQTEDTMELGLLPALEGGTHGNWIRPSMSFSISEQSKQHEAAALLIDFLTNSIEANEILKADRGVPISSEVREHLASIVEGPVKATFDYLELVADYTSPADPLSPAGESEVRGSFIRIVELIKYDKISPADAAKQFREEAEAILQ